MKHREGSRQLGLSICITALFRPQMVPTADTKDNGDGNSNSNTESKSINMLSHSMNDFQFKYDPGDS